MIFEFFIYLRTYNPTLSAITVKKNILGKWDLNLNKGKKCFSFWKNKLLVLYLYADAKTFKVNLYLVVETGIQFIL